MLNSLRHLCFTKKRYGRYKPIELSDAKGLGVRISRKMLEYVE
jgi:hypothetical protein